MGLDDEEEEGYFDDDDDNQSYSFPPPLSEYEAADMSVQPGITIDKARTDLYIQFKKEFKAIRGMLAALPGEAGIGVRLVGRRSPPCFLGQIAPSTGYSSIYWGWILQRSPILWQHSI